MRVNMPIGRNTERGVFFLKSIDENDHFKYYEKAWAGREYVAEGIKKNRNGSYSGKLYGLPCVASEDTPHDRCFIFIRGTYTPDSEREPEMD